jgi:hypothetical protein
VVLCMDGKSQIQTLDHTQASLPLKPRPRRLQVHLIPDNYSTHKHENVK